MLGAEGTTVNKKQLCSQHSVLCVCVCVCVCVCWGWGIISCMMTSAEKNLKGKGTR